MALERRDGRVYYYTSKRYGTRVYREYGGAGLCATLAAQLDGCAREERKFEAWDRADRLRRLKRRNAALRAWLARGMAAVAAALTAAGWHRHNREWRRKRGAMATPATAEQARATWVPAELAEMAGSLDKATDERAAKGDASVLGAVDAFLDNPAAAALWGDVGRRLLQRWVKLYAGDCLVTQRAVWRVASDLRSRLAGPRPSALEVLVAERVVTGWVFAHWCEGQYARLLDKLTIPQHKFHLARVEMAHRNLMAAARTLAKVRRAKLPDVLALVNVAPAPSPGRDDTEDGRGVPADGPRRLT